MIMVYEIIDIYRVVCDEHYNQVRPETHWCLDKKQCDDYIAASSYKHCLRIEKSTLSNKAIKL